MCRGQYLQQSLVVLEIMRRIIPISHTKAKAQESQSPDSYSGRPLHYCMLNTETPVLGNVEGHRMPQLQRRWAALRQGAEKTMCLDHMCMHGVLNRQGLHVHPGICHQAPLSAGTDCACYHSVLAYVFWAFALGYE